MAGTTPIPVILAREALEILKSEGAVTLELEKALPAYALQQEKSGEEVTADGLLTVARLGAEHIKTLTTSKQKPTEKEDPLDAYARIVKSFGVIKNPYISQKLKLQEQISQSPKLQFFQACGHGDIEGVKHFVMNGGDVTCNSNYAIKYCVENGDILMLDLLIAHGANAAAFNNTPLIEATKRGHDKTVEFLLQHGADANAKDNYSAIEYAASQSSYRSVLLLAQHGADLAKLSIEKKEKFKSYEEKIPLWQKLQHIDPPPLIYNENPVYFRKTCYETVIKILKMEEYGSAEFSYMAFAAAGLFQSEQNLLKYLEKHGTAGNQPLHDLIQMIKLPKDGSPNLKDWGDAVLKCGPSMAKLVKFSDRLPSPMKSADGKTWSMVNTRAECAKFAFNKAAEHPALAALCMEYNVEEDDFEMARIFVKKKTPATKNIPDISIDGEKFDMAGAKFYRLPDGDIRGLFLGEMTACCQSIGGAGTACAKHGYISPDSGFYVVENAKGKIIAQTWAWRGTRGEMCFDSLETLGKNVSPEQWAKIIHATAAELTTRKDHDVTELRIGDGGGTPNHFLRDAFSDYNTSTPIDRPHNAQPKNYTSYRDSEGPQILVWKKPVPHSFGKNNKFAL
jgi:hypothetical protein